MLNIFRRLDAENFQTVLIEPRRTSGRASRRSSRRKDRRIDARATWDVKDLEYWDEKIREQVEASGSTAIRRVRALQSQRHARVHGVSASRSHYPHWSYGKAFEKLKTALRIRSECLPYEMVINSNPPSPTSCGTTRSASRF